MDCFGTYLTHAQSCDNVHVQSATGRTASVHTHAQSCDNVHVQSATDWAASVHTLHMPKAVIKFVFEVYGMDCWRTYLHMPKSVITFVFKVLRNGLCFRRFRVFAVFAFLCLAFSRFRVPPAAPPRPGHRFRVHSLFLAACLFMFLFEFIDSCTRILIHSISWFSNLKNRSSPTRLAALPPLKSKKTKTSKERKRRITIITYQKL